MRLASASGGWIRVRVGCNRAMLERHRWEVEGCRREYGCGRVVVADLEFQG